MPVGRSGSRRTYDTSTPAAPIASTRWSPKPSAPTRPTHRVVCPAAASVQATLDSAPPIPRSKEGTAAARSAGGAEVGRGGGRRVAATERHVGARGADRLDEVVAEAVGAAPADPRGGVSGGGERAGHVGLGAADTAVEGGDVGEAAGP